MNITCRTIDRLGCFLLPRFVPICTSYPILNVWRSSSSEEDSEEHDIEQNDSSKTAVQDKKPYRPVHGINLPYPKIPSTMDNFIFRDKQSPDEIEAALFGLWDRITIREIEAAFYALKRMVVYPSTSLLEKLAKKTIEKADQATSRHVTSIFLASARLKYFNATLFECLAVEALKEEKIQDFRGFYSGMTIYALGVLHRYFLRTRPADKQPEIFFPHQMKLIDALVNQMMTRRDEAGQTNQNIGNCIYGLAILNYRHEALLNVLSEEASRPERVETFNEQEISNMIYGFGLLRYRHDRVLSNFCDILRRPDRLRGWKEQGLSNVIYGFAMIPYHPPSETLYELIWETCQEDRLKRFYNQHLMNVTHGLALMGIKSYKVYKCLIDELVSRRKRFELMLIGLSSVVYSLSLAGIYLEGIKTFLDELTSDKNIQALSDQAITNLFFALGNFSNDDELLPFLKKLLKESIRTERLCRFNERHFSQILFGLSKCTLTKNVDPDHITHLIQGGTVPAFLETYTSQGLANLVYALAHLHYHDQETHSAIAKIACSRMQNLEDIALATLVYSWSLIPYRNEDFLRAVGDRLIQEGALSNFSEQVLGNLLFGLIRLDFQNMEAFQKILHRIQQPDTWDQFIYVTSSQRIHELLTVDWLDGYVRQTLEMNLKRIKSRNKEI